MTQVDHPTFLYRGQHRRHPGDPAVRCVEGIWARLHEGVDPEPIRDLGRRPHVPQHAADPVRKRVYL
jgi:hypothetical protein